MYGLLRNGRLLICLSSSLDELLRRAEEAWGNEGGGSRATWLKSFKVVKLSAVSAGEMERINGWCNGE